MSIFEKEPHAGIIVLVSVVLIFVFSAFLSGTEEKKTGVTYNTAVKPGVVTYGTHSTGTSSLGTSYIAHRTSYIPRTSSFVHRTSYGSSSSKGLYTTSSATVHSIGSGGGGGGGAVSGGARSSSSNGMSYGGGFVTMPVLAAQTPSLRGSGNSSASAAPAIGPRRVHSDGFGGYEGDYSGEYYDGYGYWNATTEEWVETNEFEGAIKYEGGKTYQYKGGAWVLIADQTDPGMPVGDTPWVLFLLLAAAYLLRKSFPLRSSFVHRTLVLRTYLLSSSVLLSRVVPRASLSAWLASAKFGGSPLSLLPHPLIDQ